MDWTQVAIGGAVVALAIALAVFLTRRATPADRVTAIDARADELRRQLAETGLRLDVAQKRIGDLEALRAVAEAKLEEARTAGEAQKQFLAEASGQMQTSFKSLAADALRDSREELLTAADRLLKGFSDTSAADLDTRQAALAQLVAPLKDALEAYKNENKALEQQRMTQLGTVGEQYRELSSAAGSLRLETAKLSNALRSPHVRGNWGQLTLRRSAELAGMVAHCDFYEQETIGGDDRRVRPDMVVRLPARRLIVVDSKVPMDGYLAAVDATDDASRAEALRRHARQTRDHVARLASKDYQSEFEEAPEFVVAFVPSDSILAAAVEVDPDLVEFALEKKVVISTPATFFALLRTIAFGWRQEEVAENAQRIQALGQQLAERLNVMVTHLDKLGGALRRAVEAYNETVSSLEARVLPSARRFRSLGVATSTIVEIEPIQVVPRSVLLPPAAGDGVQELFPDQLEAGDAPLEPVPNADDDWVDGPELASFTCTCRVCGREFEGSGPNAHFCSMECRDAARSQSAVQEPVRGDDR